jgi:hypothetical protein
MEINTGAQEMDITFGDARIGKLLLPAGCHRANLFNNGGSFVAF